jgi:hypothetical protein
MILLVAIAVILVSVVINLGGTVNALWASSLEDGLGTLSAAAEGIGDMDDAPCPYAYDAGTGRWHDPANGYAFVTFEEAAEANCS